MIVVMVTIMMMSVEVLWYLGDNNKEWFTLSKIYFSQALMISLHSDWYSSEVKYDCQASNTKEYEIPNFFR